MPLSGIKIDPPLPVECLKASAPYKAGDRCYVIAVYASGRVMTGTAASLGLEMSGIHDMERFRELVTTTTTAAANDNKKP